ncbi:MAG: hypothetical protein ACT4QE_04180, partial [Anaerolineales bacterium]
MTPVAARRQGVEVLQFFNPHSISESALDTCISSVARVYSYKRANSSFFFCSNSASVMMPCSLSLFSGSSGKSEGHRWHQRDARLATRLMAAAATPDEWMTMLIPIRR